jgi:peptidoglycan/xylan/chitin deacetylase (PgdA/CDA1 family)
MTDSNQTNRVETVVAKGLVDDEQKVVYLTFDDGPVNGTDNILDVLEEEHIPATMFYIGKQILNNKDIYKRTLLCDSVSIGNHTYCHANGKYRDFYRNANILVQDINRNNEIIARDKKSVSTSPFLPVRLAGRNVFRLPRLNRDDNAINPKERSIEHIGYEKVAKEGFYIYGWDVEWTHGAKGTPNESPSEIASLINKLQAHKSSREPNKIILLMHDYMFKSTLHGKENLLALIHLLKKSGWKFSTIENYLAD